MTLSERLSEEGLRLYEIRPVKGFVRTEIDFIDSEEDLSSGNYTLKNDEEVTDDFEEIKAPEIQYVVCDSLGRTFRITPGMELHP